MTSPRPTWDIVIVGCGIVGAWTAAKLAAFGITRVLVVEAGRVGSGVTNHSSAGVRVFHLAEHLAELAAASIPDHCAMARRYGDAISYRAPGSLYFLGEREAAAAADRCEALTRANWPVELIDSVRGARCFPQFRWQRGDHAVFEPLSALFDPVLTARQLMAQATELGITLAEGTPVTKLHGHDDGTVGIEVAGEVVTARWLLLAAGTATESLIKPLGIKLGHRLKAIQVNTFVPPKPLAPAPMYFDGRLRTFGRVASDGTYHAGYALADWSDAPSDAPPSFSGEDARRALKLATERVPALADARIAGGIRAWDAYRNCHEPVLVAPEPYRVMVLGGLGGTGFKVAPAIAQRAAEQLKRQFTSV